MRRQKRQTRRKAVKTIAAGAAAWPALRVLDGFAQRHAAHQGTQPAAGKAAKAGPFRPAFFTAQEFATVRAVTERMIPSDDTPGAREANVAEWVDRSVKDDPRLHEVYREGLRRLERQAMARHKLPFIKLGAGQQDTLLQDLADMNATPPSAGNAEARFFRSIRGLTIDIFYTSRIGLKELGYNGNTFLLEFKGCTHPEHL